MPGTSPGGWPYVLPSDLPVNFPDMSQDLALQLDPFTTWTPYTPTPAGATYSAILAGYCKQGPLVTVVIKATVSSVSGSMIFSLPLPAHADQVTAATGVARCAVASGNYYLAVYLNNTTNCALGVMDAKGQHGNVSATNPATWQAGNTVQFTITYRAA